jgi:hypothetical protein
MGQREDRRRDTGAITKLDVSMGLPCLWPPRREYTPARRNAIAALTGSLPLVAPAR